MYNTILKKVIWLIERLLILMLAASIIIIVLQVCARYIFKSPLKWSEQLARMLFIWMIFLGVPVAYYRNSAVRFDLILDNMTGKWRIVFEIIINTIVVFFAVFFCYCSAELCIKTGSRMTSGVVMPQNALYIAMPISMLLLVLVMVSKIFEIIKTPQNEQKEE